MRAALLAFLILLSLPLFAKENPHDAMGQFILREWLMFIPEDAFNTNGPGPTLAPEVLRKNHVRTATLRHDNRWTEDKRDSAVHSVLYFDTTGRLTELHTTNEIWKYTYDSLFTHYPSSISVYYNPVLSGLREIREFRYDIYGNPVSYVSRDFEWAPSDDKRPIVHITTFSYRETPQHAYVEITRDDIPIYVYRYAPDSSSIYIMNEQANRNKGFQFSHPYREISCNKERCVGDYSIQRGIDTMYRRTRFYFAYEEETQFTVYYKRDAAGRLIEVSEDITSWKYTYFSNGLPDRSMWSEFLEPEWPEQAMYFEYTYYK